MNRFPGTIVAIEAAGGVALVDVAVGARRYTATLIDAGGAPSWRVGMAVALLFQETEVSLAKNLSGMISMRNRMVGTVTAVERGRLLSKVTLDVDGHAVDAVITTRSCDALQLALGDAVEGLVKANEMTLREEGAA
ncbi:MAG TPA: TOBE domain-containing protein [Paucimonas sp.]|nr:TOBE domain-containing protein [Paucimonas sp.]